MDAKKRIGARIRQARREKNLSQADVSKYYGSSVAFISQVERGITGVGINTLRRFAGSLDKPVSWFLSDTADIPPRPLPAIISDFELATAHLKAVSVPVLGTIPAGYPFPEEESISEYITIPKSMLGAVRTNRYIYALRVSGDSLQEDGIISGDLVVLDPKAGIQDGKIYALRLGNEVVLRHLHRENSHLRLEAANANYQPILVDEVEILGQVVVSLRKY